MENTTAMYSYDPNDKKIPIDTEDYYEEIASQEEFYLENSEEQVRMKLEADGPRPTQAENPNQQREDAAEELITGDSDDPPLSEEAVERMLEQ